MAAGVPITNPVAGISIGLVKEGDKWVLLTDIIGDEDHFGDMDFKIAGTQNGITGIQLDLKIEGISEEIIRATLDQSREARMEILRKMLTAIPRPRRRHRRVRTAAAPYEDRSGEDRHADRPGRQEHPRHPGRDRRHDRRRRRRHGHIAGADRRSAEAGLGPSRSADRQRCRSARSTTARVTSIKDFGAFVEILPGRDGLCHISELSDGYVDSVDDMCRLAMR